MRRALVVAVPLVSLAVALAIAEVALRVAGFEFAVYPSRVQVGWPDPSILRSRYRPDPELLWVPIDYGARVAAARGTRPSIVFMGDSCTEFGSYDEALQSIVHQQQADRRFTFVNVGVGGWSSYQGARQLERDVLPMQPRLVTIYYGWNDHWRSFGIEDKGLGDFNMSQPRVLLALWRLRIAQVVLRAAFDLAHRPPPAIDARPERVSLADFAANLTRMVRIARDHRIVPVLLTAPSSHKVGQEPASLQARWMPNLRQLVPVHEAYVEAVREVGAREHVVVVDLYAEFRRAPDAVIRRSFGEDGIHLTVDGNRKIAEVLYERLENYLR